MVQNVILSVNRNADTITLADKSMKITDRPGNYFWSNGYSWGTVQVTEDDVTIEVINGTLSLKSLTVGSRKGMKLKHFDFKEGDVRNIKLHK